jgi:hypothetical protein
MINIIEIIGLALCIVGAAAFVYCQRQINKGNNK